MFRELTLNHAGTGQSDAQWSSEPEPLFGIARPFKGIGIGLAWYDFICPFCYVGQQRTDILVRHGLVIIEVPFEAHPEIPVEGVAVGARTGPMYEMLEREAAAAGLPLNWPARLPNSGLALAAAEWTRRTDPERFAALHSSLFAAHFALRQDLGDPAVIDEHLSAAGIDTVSFWTAVEDSSPEQAVAEAEAIGRSLGVRGTPAWFVNQRLISGLQPASRFEELAAEQQEALV
jgi:predicted DsbA family dithiol-disulfide isomerase